jgi:pSer/pThr/pTyr-binding forkhead associated (FHA) protein
MREEREKWRREFTFKFAEAQVVNNSAAQKMATQFAIGVLVRNPDTPDREKTFVPPNCRLTVGRSADCTIVLDDPGVSRLHFAFCADDTNVFVEEIGRSANAILLNGEQVTSRRVLKTDDTVTAGATTFRFQRLSTY